MTWPVFAVAPSCVTCKPILTTSEGKAGIPELPRGMQTLMEFCGTSSAFSTALLWDKRAISVVPLPLGVFLPAGWDLSPFEGRLTLVGSSVLVSRRHFVIVCIYTSVFEKAVPYWRFHGRQSEAALRPTSPAPALDCCRGTGTCEPAPIAGPMGVLAAFRCVSSGSVVGLGRARRSK